MKVSLFLFFGLIVVGGCFGLVAAFSGSGAGTSASPFMITTCLQLNETGTNLTAFYTVANDIDCSDTVNWDSGRGFTPIGPTTSTYFRSTFNGNNYTISNIYINRSSTNLGLFGVAGFTSYITNVRIVNMTIFAQNGAEAVGMLAGATTSTSKINGSNVHGNLYASSNVGYFGGLVGSASGDYIISSSSGGSINGHGWRMGGLIGFIAGTTYMINTSYSTANVNSTYTSGVSAGFIGAFNSGIINNCYARGNVTGTSGTIAGFVSTQTTTINNSYSTGNLSGSASKYGFCGSGTCTGITNSFWDNRTAGTTSNGGGTSRNTSDMKTQSTFTSAGWDFVGTWRINESINDGYPYLLAFSNLDYTGPSINITFPIGGINYTSILTMLNYTVTDPSNASACWYSTNAGVTNSSLVTPGINFTELTSVEGQNNWTVYCNDTLNNLGGSTARFRYDTTPPVFTNIANLSSVHRVGFNYNLTASDGSGIGCYSVNDTSRFAVNCSGYLRNSTTLGVGYYWLNVTVNDTIGNLNWSLMTVNVSDIHPPALTIASPANNTNSSNVLLNVNYTVSDTYLHSCWYSNDTLTLNYSLTCGSNITGVTWGEGQHNITIYANDSWGNTNQTWVRFTIDTVYPQFFNITDNNGTVSNGGVAVFNVSVVNTNGTVLLSINNTNYTASSLGNNAYNVSITLVNKTYNYTWVSWGNGSARNMNRSANMSYTVLNTSSDITRPTVSLMSPANASTVTTASVYFVANFSDAVQLANVTLFVWNSTNSLINSTSQNVNGTQNSTNISVTLPYVGTFKWNYRATDNSSNTAFNHTNYTLTYGDAAYPVFSNFVDTNGTLLGNGSARFNATVVSTNGTVFLSINNTNYTAQNVSASVYNVSVNLSNGTYNYYWGSWGNGSSANYNISSLLSYTVLAPDGIAPQIVITSPANNTNSTNGGLPVTYTVSDTYLHSCWYSNDSMGVNVTLSNCANITGVSWADGQHNVTVYANDTSGNTNRSFVRFIIDTTAPVWYANTTTIEALSSGVVHFNITINDSNAGSFIFSFYNGTVWENDSSRTYSNGIMINASRTLEYTNVTVNWTWYMNDSFGTTNQTPLFGIRLGNYSVPESESVVEEEPVESASSDAIYEVAGSGDGILLRIFADKGSTLIQNIRDSKDSGVKQFEIKTKNWVTGEVSIQSYNSLPERCELPSGTNDLLYKALDVEHTFDNRDIESARVRIGVDKVWLEEHGIEQVRVVRCYPTYEELTVSYVDESDDEGIYDIYSQGFSIFAILGSEEEALPLQTSPTLAFSWKWLLIVLIGGALIAVIVFLKKRRASMYEDLHIKNKWFDVEWKFSFKFRSPPHDRGFNPHS